MRKKRAEKDLSGQRFGRLTVMWFCGRVRKGTSVYLCLCDCGNFKTVTAGNLPQAKSCGCILKETGIKFRKQGTAFRVLFWSYQKSAKKRGFEFLLTEEEFKKLTSSDCVYCGSAPSKEQPVKKNATYDVYVFNGVDRVDSSFGYVLDNCVPCCSTCNRLKGTFSLTDFLSAVSKIHIHKAIVEAA